VSKRIWIGMTVAVIMAMYILLPGLMKRGDVVITDFSVSESGTEMLLSVGMTSSAGYVRRIDAQQQHAGRLYLDGYAAFGGINGSLGAKERFVVPIDKNTTMIAIYRAPDCYEPILEKDGDGEWRRADEQSE